MTAERLLFLSTVVFLHQKSNVPAALVKTFWNLKVAELDSLVVKRNLICNVKESKYKLVQELPNRRFKIL